MGIIPGIKLDMGEKVTSGLDGLRERLIEYADMGLRFAKWRAVIAIGNDISTYVCIENNAIVLHATLRFVRKQG